MFSRTDRFARCIATGLALAAAPGALAQTSVEGQWAASVAWPLVASHAALLADGRVLVWSEQAGAVPRIWDPASGNLTATSAFVNTTGSGQVQASNGGIVIAGGRDASGAGLQHAGRFNAAGTTWTQMPFMLEPRNEPTLVLAGDARVLAFAGDRQPGQTCDVVEHTAIGSLSWESLDMTQALPRTPWAFLLSSGDVLVAGPDAQARRLDVGSEIWFGVGAMQAGSRDAGSAVLVPGSVDRVMTIGGRSPATNSCEVLDLPSTTSWAYTGSMARARRHHQATVLADGSILVTGGTLVGDVADQAVLPAERWVASTGTWTTLASMSVPRRRGAVALLLADGRVLCAGGGDGTPGSELHADAQIYSPPYLFLGTRPTITVAPTTIVYRGGFTLDSPQAADIDRVWLVRAGTSTRGFNGDQRALSLAFTTAPGRLTLTAPADSNIAPPGTYMAFVVNDAGAPSIARLMRLEIGVPAAVPPDITSSAPTATQVNSQYTYVPAASGSEPLTWSLPQAPAWLAVSPATGAVAGTPTTTGQFTVRLRATNSAGFDEQQWTLDVVSSTAVRTVSPLGTTWRYFKGTTNPPSNWATIAFNDATWATGPSGFGFGDNDDATVLADMQNVYTTVFTRLGFTVYNVQTVTKVSVLFEYDDGLAVFLNGTRILARNAPATIVNTSVATGSHEATANLTRMDFTDATTRALLVNGANVVAAVGLNQTISSGDVTLKVVFELTGGTTTPVDAGGEPPAVAALESAGPNPFTAFARLRFRLVEPGAARLRIYDPAGRLVRTISPPALPPGAHDLTWDGTDAGGVAVAPGVYFYRLEAPGLDRSGKWTRAR